jgi:uncharacterized OsmC-like protein
MTVMTFSLSAQHPKAGPTSVTAKQATLLIDTSLTGSQTELNPVELLMASQAACFLKGIERIAPTLNFSFSNVNVFLEAQRPETEARISDLAYRIEIETEETDARLELLHKNLKRQGTIYNTISASANLHGEIIRVSPTE